MFGASSKRLFGALLAVTLATASATHASAQPAKTAEETARALFDEGRALAEANRWKEACPKFEMAYRLVHTGGTTIQLARCYEKIGRSKRALQLYEQIVEQAATENPERVAVARERAEELRRIIAAEEKAAPPPRPDPDPEPAPEPEPRQPPHLWAIVSFSVSGAALTLGAIMGGIALSEMNAVKEQCQDNVCPNALEAKADAAMAKGWVANIALPVGGAALVAGLVLYFVLDDEQAESARLSLTPSGIRVRY